MSKTNRRNVLRAGAAISAGIVSGAAFSPGDTEAQCRLKQDCGSTWEREYDFGHKMLFMDEYHQATLEILGRLSGEIDHIGELSSRAVSVIKNGGTVYNSMNIGHQPIYETKEKHRGNPGHMKDHDGFDDMKKGDMVFTNHCTKAVQKARDRGVYVVCATVNYINNEFRPENYTNPNEDDLLLGDVSNEVLHSHVPHTQGLVHAPEIPEISICASTTTGTGSLHWMLCAEIAHKLAKKKAPAVEKSADYLRILTERVQQLAMYRSRIRDTAVTMARRIRAGGRWFVQGVEHQGLWIELSTVECGPFIVNKGNRDEKNDNDVWLIPAMSPAFPDEVKLAMEKQLAGAYVIAVAPASLDGKVPHGRLLDIADAGFDNLSPESGGVIGIKGMKETICPTSGVVGNIIQQMICAQWVDEMVRRGSVPYFYQGVCQIGGRELNKVMQPFFERQGF
ncbi:hypothetical protein ACFL60_06845 [Candidatus Omnitrophota bacterium]